MGSYRNYAALGFRRSRKGPLEPGEAQKCVNADEARKKAEQISNRRGYSGAVAFACNDPNDQDLITIAAYGDVPPEMRDVLPF